MEDIKQLLEQDFDKTVKLLISQGKTKEQIADYIKEYAQNERDLRPTQLGSIQKDKVIGKGAKTKLIKAVQIITPYAKKIVKTAVAFEVGAAPTLIAQKNNDLSKQVLAYWEDLRMDDQLQKIKTIQKSETECALLFYLKKVENSQEIKTKILKHDLGLMYPFFDENGDMIYFTWIFNTIKDNKSIKNVYIYTDKICYKYQEENGKNILIENLLHGFSKIPVVYISQDFPEWHDAISLIDRFEVCLSKLGASNDYSGHPMLKIYGEVASMPDKNDDGKTLRFPMKEVTEDGKTINGDAEFLTNSNAPESVKLEMEKLENLIYALTSTPNLSFDNLKGSIGNVSGIALKLLFLDTIIKAKTNEGDNKTMIQRILNVIKSGITTIINKKLKGLEKETRFNILFNSILPNDLKEAVDTIVAGKNAGVISTETSVNFLDLVQDKAKEIELIKAENKTSI